MNPSQKEPHDPRPNEGSELPGTSGSPGKEDSSFFADDPRLPLAAQEYLAELEAGKRPDRRRWLDRYPDLAEQLNPCLDGLEFVYRETARVNATADVHGGWAHAEGPHGTTPLGDFQIVREVGRGGMGIVYEAVQLSLGRRVALKVLPFAATFDTKHLKRFQHEAQAAAQLHHTNIVPVYAVGCERGIHFYAMQLIQGQSLDIVIRDLRQRAGLNSTEAMASGASAPASHRIRGDAPRLDSTIDRPGVSPIAAEPPPSTSHHADDTLSQISNQFSNAGSDRHRGYFGRVARCMMQAAEGLEYAHQQGIIHRDIKPANLLIDTRGNVWITDFGLVHFHEGNNLTETGDVVGTVRYMSPEQALGQRVVLDHRADVYSLGATFYEMLTLRPVFSGNSRHTMLAQVLNSEPRSPRSIDRAIPPELETIVLKCLGKTPAERYGSAQALADDLHRFLRDEPIHARRPSLWERLRKWARRHPSFIGACVLTMFVTLMVSLVSNGLITQANNRTQDALLQERLRAEEARNRFKQARKAADFLIDISQQELANIPPLQGLRKRLLEFALVYYQDFVTQSDGDASSQAELVAVEHRLKKVLDDLSILEGAGQIILLSNQDIQQDLSLTSAQRERVESIARAFDRDRRDSFRDFERLGQSERRERFMELVRVNDQAMRTEITQAQQSRLRQIMLQLMGPGALAQPEIASRLNLSNDQRGAIQEIEARAMASLWDRIRDAKRHDDFGDHRETIMRATMKDILAIFTPSQRATWNEIVGDPFRGSLNAPPPNLMLPP